MLKNTPGESPENYLICLLLVRLECTRVSPHLPPIEPENKQQLPTDPSVNFVVGMNPPTSPRREQRKTAFKNTPEDISPRFINI